MMCRKIILGGKIKTISALIGDFLEYIEVEKGRALGTARNYDHYLSVFADFSKKQKIFLPQKFDLELVTKYRRFLNRQGLSPKTLNYYLIALRTFLKFLLKNNLRTLTPEKIELAKTSERQITFLELDELEEILKMPDPRTVHGLRDQAILELLFSTGLRVSELCQLKRKDINPERGEFSVKGKGGKVRVVFIDKSAKESLKKYLNTRTDKSEHLFISYGHTNNNIPTGEKRLAESGITPRSVQRMIQKYALMAGITKKVTPHVMRHTFATDLLMAGSDLRAVQALLGHSSITTTQIYTHVTDKHLYEVHQAFHGLRRKQKFDVS